MEKLPENVYVLALNGPPRCGKDTLAKMIQTIAASKADVLICPMAMPLRNIAFSMIPENYTPEIYEEIKETPIAEFDNLTLRQLLIVISEEWMKPKFGPWIFGKLWVNQMIQEIKTYGMVGLGTKRPLLFVVPDAGFQQEQAYVAERTQPAQYALAQIHRPGTNFSNDSRSYVELLGRFKFNVRNIDGLEELEHEAKLLLRKFGECCGIDLTF